MGSRLRVFLAKEQDKKLSELINTNGLLKVKDRAEVIRLNAHAWYVEKIAAHFGWTNLTVREVLHKWQESGLWDKAGRGGKTKWQHLKKDELAEEMFEDK